jgi:hypothetical protein
MTSPTSPSSSPRVTCGDLVNSIRAMRGVKAHHAREALELHRPDLREDQLDTRGGIDHLLGDENLAGPRVVGDP